MTVMEAIEARKSIRAYSGQPIEAEKLDRVLEAGRLAPSAKNQQAWKFVVVTDPALRARMVEACSGQKFVGEAPAVLVVCADNRREMLCGQLACTVDCSIALSFMMLEAAEQGLGTCWLGAFSADAVRELLQIPEQYAVVAVTPLGYPAVDGNPRSRKSRDEVVVREHF